MYCLSQDARLQEYSQLAVISQDKMYCMACITEFVL